MGAPGAEGKAQPAISGLTLPNPSATQPRPALRGVRVVPFV
jgi:hypothetical protein